MKKKANKLQFYLQYIWKKRISKIASVDIVTPKELPISVPILSFWTYLRTAVKTSAPLSTLSMIVITILMAACSIGQSYILGVVTEQALANKQQYVITLLIVLMSFWLAAPLFQSLNSLARLYTSQNLRIAVTDHLTARIMYARNEQISQNAVGNLVERIELASFTLPAVVTISIDTIIKLITISLLTSIVLMNVSLTLGLVSSIWMLSAILLSCFLAYSGMNVVEDASDAHAKVIANLTEIITNIPLIKSFSAQIFEREYFNKFLSTDLYTSRLTRSYWFFVLIIESIYKWFFGVFIITYTIIQYASGNLMLSQVVMIFSLLIALSWHFESVAFHFVELFDSLGVLKASLRELSKFSIDNFVSSKEIILPTLGKIVFRNVSAKYGDISLFKDLNFAIEAYSKVGIVGPSGAGKSTLLSILKGELHIDSGTVEIHGCDLEKISPHYLTHLSSESTQSALMFNRSIRDNLKYGNSSVSDDEIKKALLYAQASKLVQNLPHELNTVIGERGSALSTGERQRLSIARAFLKNATLLMLDEATSNIDSISESKIINYVLENMPRTTVLVITHRVSTLMKFDKIILMKDGHIDDIGTPQDLIERSHLFRDLMKNADQYKFDLNNSDVC
ncbi:ABC transporter ATP-binding protein [Acinetobacter oleivorans]|uniref:ABC transporter ATP-binding protein n=1 Tax=Acinetobacter oleivorans TaxID=1148157 RepID=UPI00178CF43A|nr:ABC transporter ATP-binding protein [Acinetobacter oleivorans]MBE2173815.1 ABC transporter ATP-binding protein [Acinetobacter oleivorans]